MFSHDIRLLNIIVNSHINKQLVFTLHGNNVLSSGGCSGQLNGSLYCFRTRVPEEEGIKGRVRHNR